MSAVAAAQLRSGAVPALLWQRMRTRLDLVALGLLMVGLLFLPKGIPGGIAGLGVVNGATLAMQGVGMVLIFRATRVFNFAVIQLGAISGLVFYELIHHTQFALVAYVACGSCFSHLPSDTTYLQSHPAAFLQALQSNGYGGWVTANFWLSVVVALLIAPLVSWVVYKLVVRRFERAPRLIVTVVTVAVAQLLVAIANYLPQLLFQDLPNESAVTYIGIPDVNLNIAPVVFHVGDVLMVGVAVVAALGLAAFFLVSSTGIAMRGAADNPGRAQTLGISVSRLSSISWMLAGALSGLAAIIGVIQDPGAMGGGSGLQVAPLVEVLAAVVIARLVSLPLVVVGAFAVGVIGQVFFWNFSSNVPYDGALLLIIGGILLLQSARQSRAEQEASAGYLAAREARPIPPVLRRLSVVDAGLRWFGLVVAVLVLGFPFVMSPADVSLGSVILIYTIIGLSLLVLTGWAGQISLGQFAFAAVGGYVAAVLSADTGAFILIDLVVGGLAGAAVAMLVGIPALRLRGLYLAVSTLALALATSSVLLDPNWLGRFLPASLDRPSLLGFDLNDEKVFFYVCLLFVVVTVFAVVGLRRSRTARALIACRDNEQAAQSLGINLFRARLEAFAISGFIAAFAGALFAFHEHGVEPGAFSAEQSINIFIIVVIGGLGSVLGPLLGAVYNGLFLLFSNTVLSLLGTSAGVLAVLLLFPGGLSGIAYSLRDAWLRRVAIRYRVPVPSLVSGPHAADLDGQSPIAPKTGAGAKAAFVPQRYRLLRQWEGLDEEPVAGG